MAGSEVGTQLDHDLALGGLHDERVLGIERHQICLSLDGARPWKRMENGRPAILAPRLCDNLIGVQARTASTTESVKRSAGWVAAFRFPGDARLAEQRAVAAQAEPHRRHGAGIGPVEHRRLPAAAQGRRNLGRACRAHRSGALGVVGESEPMRPISPAPGTVLGVAGRCWLAETPADARHKRWPDCGGRTGFCEPDGGGRTGFCEPDCGGRPRSRVSCAQAGLAASIRHRQAEGCRGRPA
jgi:hypothetical protein